MYAARIVDWRDVDDDISPNGGAERGAYRAAVAARRDCLGVAVSGASIGADQVTDRAAEHEMTAAAVVL